LLIFSTPPVFGFKSKSERSVKIDEAQPNHGQVHREEGDSQESG
jgi:hypothetical protein